LSRAPVSGPGQPGISRSASLDALRAVAVLLVLGRHLPAPTVIGPILAAWKRGGWVGVDLFFVLSGFLVSGLIFREHQKRGSFSVGSFLLRRGLKIYPAFYVLLATTVAVELASQGRVWLRAVAVEGLFLQNYARHTRLWDHTWSLAVEEHFYIALAFGLFALLRAFRSFALVPYLYPLAAIACLAGRAAFLGRPHDLPTVYSPTHLRIDSLLCGVGLSYWFHYCPVAIARIKRFKALFLPTGCLLLAAPFFLKPEDPLIWTIGLTVFAWGAACCVLWAATVERWSKPLTLLAAIGAYSYSIYLWHLPVLDWILVPYVLPLTHGRAWPFIAVYVVSSCALGIAMSKLIEYPVLRLRDRWLPSRS